MQIPDQYKNIRWVLSENIPWHFRAVIKLTIWLATLTNCPEALHWLEAQTLDARVKFHRDLLEARHRLAEAGQRHALVCHNPDCKHQTEIAEALADYDRRISTTAL